MRRHIPSLTRTWSEEKKAPKFHLKLNWWLLWELPTIPLHPLQRYSQTVINQSFTFSNWTPLSICWKWEPLTLGCDDFTLCQRRLWACQECCITTPNNTVSSFKSQCGHLPLQKYSPDRRSVGGGDSMEVTALEAFTSPTAFKKELKYLVKISLDDDKLVVCKMLSNKSGTSVQSAILKFCLSFERSKSSFFPFGSNTTPYSTMKITVFQFSFPQFGRTIYD